MSELPEHISEACGKISTHEKIVSSRYQVRMWSLALPSHNPPEEEADHEDARVEKH